MMGGGETGVENGVWRGWRGCVFERRERKQWVLV
jgi:hypothetical protein